LSAASKVPAHLEPYVEVLGPAKAIEFLLAFGGAPIYLADRPQARSKVAELIGVAKAKALAGRIGAGHVRVPNGKPWIARQLRADGEGVFDIARRLHVTDATVRNFLKAGFDDRQPSLFD
jgi:hypothetical protein